MKIKNVSSLPFLFILFTACATPSNNGLNNEEVTKESVNKVSTTEIPKETPAFILTETPTYFPTGPTPVIFDTDMAVDDWGAILYMLQNKDADVLGISLVGDGEATCDPGVTNILRLVTLANHEPIPVACANPVPMAGSNTFPQGWRDAVNSFNGKKNIKPAKNPATTDNAIEMMKDLLINSGQPVTFIVTGPTTNIAQLLKDYPELKNKIKQFFVMGGAVETSGNVDPDYEAEWNFYIDPMADNILLNSGVPLTLGSTDYTNNIPFNETLYKQMLAKQNTPAAKFLVEYEKANSWRLNSGIYLWDQSTAVMMMNESIVRYRTAPMCVIEEGTNQGDIVQDQGCPTNRYGFFVSNLEVFIDYWRVINGE